MSFLEHMAPGALGPGFAGAAIFVLAWAIGRRRCPEEALEKGALLAAAATAAVLAFSQAARSRWGR